MANSKLSTLQIELLKVFALNPSKKELEFVRKMLSAYFSSTSENADSNAIEDFFNNAVIQIIQRPSDNTLPFSDNDSFYNQILVSKQSKNALAKAIEKEEPLIIE